jgi:glyoxylase-like metal-dependent hydrolase (beta-lactamase superfamily II)
MHPTSAAQFDAAQFDAAAPETVRLNTAGLGRIPPLEPVRDGLWVYGVPLPGLQPHFTLSYLVLDAEKHVHLIDPGWDTESNRGALAAALGELGHALADVASVTVTHLHPDHLGLAAHVRESSGAPVALHRLEQEAIGEVATPVDETDAVARFAAWGASAARHPELLAALLRRSAWRPFTADRLLEDGDALGIPGHDIEVLHTPGHTVGHLALRDAPRRLLFTGDLLLPNQYPGVGLGGTPAGNPIDDYLASLERVVAFDDHEVLPGHGYRFTGLADRIAETREHHERRTREVAAVVGSSPEANVWEVASRLSWTAGWEQLSGLHLLSALAQTELHLERVRSSRTR